MLTLRNYQFNDYQRIRQAVQNLKKELERPPRVLYQLPTGGGKGAIVCHFNQQVQSKGGSIMNMIHKKPLLKDLQKRFNENQIRHGIIAGGHAPSYLFKSQIAMVQTMCKRIDKYNPDLILIDECHHATASQYQQVIDANPDSIIIGLTATPVRGDGTGLDKVFDVMINGPQSYELIDMGYLTPAKHYGPERVDTEHIQIIGGDYNQKQLSELMRKPHIIGKAVEHYADICDMEPTIIFCVDLKHCEDVAKEFRDKGFKAEAVSGKMKWDELQKIFIRLANGDLHCITSCNLISEGVDIPNVFNVILLRKTQSLAVFLQQIGRGGRVAPGKEFFRILDCVGNIEIHGKFDDHREWTLEGMKRSRRGTDEEKVIMVRFCDNCFIEYESTRCPACGSCGEIKHRKIEIIAGKLKEIESKAELAAEKKAAREAAKEEKRKQKEAEDQRKAEKKAEQKAASTLKEYIEIAQKYGDKVWSARIQFEQRVLKYFSTAKPKTSEEIRKFGERYHLNIMAANEASIKLAISDEWNRVMAEGCL